MLFSKRVKQSKVLLLFLDIDGVLNTSDSFNTKYELHNNNIDVLADLVSSGKKAGLNAEVVLTSTWRLGYDADYDKCSPQVKRLIDKLSERDISIVGRTPLYKDKTRDMEILRYIKEYALSNKDFAFVTLDDDMSIFDKAKMKEINLYKVNQRTGLIRPDINKILSLV